MKILIDMDDVMIDFMPLLAEEISKKFLGGCGKSYEEIDCWDLHKVYPNLTADEIFRPIKQLYFWHNVMPKDGAVKYIRQLILDGHEVFVVTAAHPDTVKFRATFVMKNYFPFIPITNVIVTSRKQMIKGDILIDDNPQNLIGGDYIKLLMDAPHNRKCSTGSNGIIRVDNWEDTYKYIENLNELCKGE